MAISKLILNGEVQMDVTSDTVAAGSLLSGKTATKNDGTKVTGTIASKSSSDLTVSGATVTAPAGYYANAASKAVSTTTHPNPTAAITSSTGVVTASHTQGTGYVTGGTTTGTLSLTTQAGKTVTPTESAQTAVASYRWTTGPVSVAAISSTYVGTGVTTRSAADMTVAAQSVTAPAGYYSQAFTKAVTTTTHPNPTAAIVSSTGVVTATHTQTTGYVTSGTTTGTLNLTTQGATTYNTSTADRTIASNRWLTGAQTIKSVTTTNLTAANIAEGVVVKVGDVNNASRITQITGTHRGATSYTATIVGTGSTSTTSAQYAIYNSTNYFTDGETFTFVAGDSVTLKAKRRSNYSYIKINGEVVATGDDSMASYRYTLPSCDVVIYLTTNGEVNLVVATIEITENGQYNVCDYGYANVDVPGGYTIDDIATRRDTISGVISGNTSVIHNYAFFNCSNITAISFPFVNSIQPYAFNNCTSLSNIYTPNLTSIGNSAFAFCSALTSIEFPLVKAISEYAFYWCENLVTASFASASKIWSCAFQTCSKLATINMPSVTYIAEGAFSYCQALQSIHCPIATSVANQAFAYCYALSEIDLPMASAFYSGAFSGCSSLVNISCPNLSYISGYVFARCIGLSVINLPKASFIGNYAFASCYNLLSVYLLSSSVVSLEDYRAFSSTPISNYTASTGGVYGSIFVPASLYNSYITATNWLKYSARIVSV